MQRGISTKYLSTIAFALADELNRFHLGGIFTSVKLTLPALHQFDLLDAFIV